VGADVVPVVRVEDREPEKEGESSPDEEGREREVGPSSREAREKEDGKKREREVDRVRLSKEGSRDREEPGETKGRGGRAWPAPREAIVET
jgi:hypothetical protein